MIDRTKKITRLEIKRKKIKNNKKGISTRFIILYIILFISVIFMAFMQKTQWKEKIDKLNKDSMNIEKEMRQLKLNIAHLKMEKERLLGPKHIFKKIQFFDLKLQPYNRQVVNIREVSPKQKLLLTKMRTMVSQR